jgi:conjugative transfer pilus assembly protein TraH
MRRILCALLAVACLTTEASAGINQDMRNFYSSLGMSGNVTPAGVYQSQAGGYFTGGGMFIKAPVRSYQLLSITPPSISEGCGGIDLYLGGFSFINKAQFTQMLRNIGNNAVGYAFNLALQTFAPQIYSTMQDLQKVIQKINQASINSCHAAQTAVNGLVGVLTENSAKGCQAIAMARGIVSDYKDAERYCQSGGARRNIYYGMPLTPQEKEQQMARKNLLWAGMKKQTYTGLSASMKEFLMSLVGTYVIETAAGGQPDVRYLAPTALKLEQLVNGTGGVAAAEVYKCDTATDCLKPAKVKIPLDGYRKQVQAALDEIRTKLSSERFGAPAQLTANTRKLIGISRLPVLKMMTAAVALGPSVALQVENELVEPVAFDMVATYLDWAYKAAVDSARQVAATAPKELWGALMASVDSRNREFREITKNRNFMAATEILQKARFLDQVLISNLTPHFQEVFQYARAH